LAAEKISEIISLVESGKISHSVATQSIFPALTKDSEKSAIVIAEELNLIQDSDTDSITNFVQEAIDKYPDKVAEYKSGNKGLIGLFMGEVMKISKRKADPKAASQILRELLEK